MQWLVWLTALLVHNKCRVELDHLQKHGGVVGDTRAILEKWLKLELEDLEAVLQRLVDVDHINCRFEGLQQRFERPIFDLVLDDANECVLVDETVVQSHHSCAVISRKLVVRYQNDGGESPRVRLFPALEAFDVESGEYRDLSCTRTGAVRIAIYGASRRNSLAHTQHATARRDCHVALKRH